MCKYYLGIDGGGSKTAFVVINDNNKIVYESTAGPSSIDTVSLKTCKKTILDEVCKIPYELSSVFAGLGGVNTNEDINNVKAILNDIPSLKKDAIVDANNDVINAIMGGLNGNDGIILIAGTGSVAYGINNGKAFRAGGYCYQEGDAGSAYDLGINALRYLARVLDNREKPSSFSSSLIEATGCDEPHKLIKYFKEKTRTEIAKLAKIVTSNETNPHAKKIILNGVNEVFNMIKAVYNTLEFQDEVNLTIIGSLGNANTIYKKELFKLINNSSMNIKIIDKINEASYGAALKALMNYKQK